jgi:hypothetical protein
MSDISFVLRVNQAAKKKTMRQKTKLLPRIFMGVYFIHLKISSLHPKQLSKCIDNQ